MQQIHSEKAKRRLRLIEHTRLFFEDQDELSAFLNRRSIGSGNPASRRGRKQGSTRQDEEADRYDKDYFLLDNFACNLSDGVFATGEDGSLYTLAYLLDVYESTTKSKDFHTPFNSPREKRGPFISKGKAASKEKLEQTVSDLLAKYASDMGDSFSKDTLIISLGLDPLDHTYAFNNYYCAIGILLLLDAIPFCTESVRPRRNLEDDIEKTLSLVERLCKGSTSKNLKESALRLFQLKTSPRRCRFLLIFQFVLFLNSYFECNNPSLFEKYKKTLGDRIRLPKIPFTDNRRYWKDEREKGSDVYYEIENAPARGGSLIGYTAFLYRCVIDANKKVTRNRYGIQMDNMSRSPHFCRGIVTVTAIDCLYNWFLNGDLEKLSGSFIITENRISIMINESNLFKNLTLIPLEAHLISPSMREFGNVVDIGKGEENIHVTHSMSAIMKNQITLGMGKQLKVITTKQSPLLRRTLELLRISDIVRYLEINGRHFLYICRDPYQESIIDIEEIKEDI